MNKVWHRTLWLLLAGCVLAGLLIVGLPRLIRNQINAGLADMKEGYVGHVEDVSIDWLAPGVTLHELRVERPKHKVGAPFLVVQRLEVSIPFRSLLEPRIGLRFVAPVLSFVNGRTPAEQQWGPPFTLENLREKLPFDLGFVQLADMEAHLRDFGARPPVDAYVQKVLLTASPMDHCIKALPQGCDAKVKLEGTLFASASLRAQGKLTYDRKFAFDGQASVRKLVLKQLNPLLIQYAELDVEKGTLDLDARVRMRGPRYHATLLPDFENLEIMGGDRDKTRAGRELMAAMFSRMIERRDERWSIVIDGVKGRDNMKWDLQRRRPPAQTDARVP